MHEYAVFGHDRALIGRWIGFAAILLAGVISQFLSWFQAFTGWEAVSKAVFTTGLAYLGIHWVFNRWIWRQSLFGIPNLNGVWTVSGKTLDENGESKYEWAAKLDIEQDWKKIIIKIKTDSSQSNSYTATVSKKSGVQGGWQLSYSYKNEPNIEKTHELNAHKGFCEIEFDKELKQGIASYFNSSGRRTYGIMTLTKDK